MVFTRDLRVHDNPALCAAIARSEFVLPLFVLDDELLRSRVAARHRSFLLAGSLADLDSSLRARGGGLGAASDIRRRSSSQPPAGDSKVRPRPHSRRLSPRPV